MSAKGVSRQEPHPAGSIVLIIIGLAIMVGSFRYEFGSFETPGAGFLPFFSGLAMAVFAAIPFLQSLKNGWARLRALWEGTHWQRTVIVTVALVLFSLFMRDLGFVPATVLLLVCFFRLLERMSWKITLFATGVTTFGFYLVFQIWLEAQLPRGFLGF